MTVTGGFSWAIIQGRFSVTLVEIEKLISSGKIKVNYFIGSDGVRIYTAVEGVSSSELL